MRSRLLSAAPALGRIGFPAGAAGMSLLLREIVTTPGSISRTNALGAKFLFVRAIGGGSGGGMFANSTVGDGAPGSSEGVGAFFIDKDSTLSGTVGPGAAAVYGTGTIGQRVGTATTVTVTSSLGGGTVVGGPGSPPNLNTQGPTNSNLGLTQCSTCGVNALGGTLGSPGGGSGSSSPPAGSGGKAAGPYGGAGGVPNGDVNGKAPGGGGAVQPRAGGSGSSSQIGAGGDGGVVLEWYA